MPAASASKIQQPWQPNHNPWLIAVAVMAATFMEVLDTSVANVSLPHIAGNLSVTTDEATWVLTSYLVSNAIVLPITGWLGIYFGRKRLLVICVIIFTIASILCGMAPSLPFLIVARVLQGVGGGAMQPIAQAVLLESFPPEKRGVAMATYGMGVIVAPILGPTLGGWITDNYSWRWIFYINVPVGIFAVLMAQAFIEDPPYIKNAKVESVDFYGFAFLAVWLGTLQVVLDKGQQEDWFASDWIVWFSVISTVCFIAFVMRELRTDHPIVNLRVLKNRNFVAGVVLITCLGGVLYGTTAALPIFLQTLMGYPALQSGYALSPRGIGALITTFIVGRLIGKVPNRLLITVGFILLAMSSFWLGMINLQISVWNIIWPSVLNGIAISFIFVALTTSAMGHLRQEQMGNAAGIYNLMRNLGGSFGIASVTTIIARRSQIHQALMVGHLTPYDPAYTQQLAAAQHALTPSVGSWLAHEQALGLLYNSLLQQSTLWAFVENFRLFGILCLVCLPLILLFKRVRRGQKAIAAH
ncbi:MAG TPA: DHA2 family efflux MFS transporter permease subunit [Verrucomicrobiae bacterium]|jgi:DHA2 family multidrug resistance protein|nr:DHA2 family efflux MFS transporter permease subunit [Verrucomicrobiae bacterium]